MTDSYSDSHDILSPEPLKVLCVDDNEDAADTLGEMLSISGHEVAVCHDGESALGVVESGFHPDVAILDINMPGIDGCQLAAALAPAATMTTSCSSRSLRWAITARSNGWPTRALTCITPSRSLPENLYSVLHERSAQLAASRH